MLSKISPTTKFQRAIAVLAGCTALSVAGAVGVPAVGVENTSAGSSQRAVTLTASWPADSVTRTSEQYVTGTVPGISNRTVVLQRRVPGSWANFATTTSVAGVYRLRVPTNTLGKFTLRVLVPVSGNMGEASTQRASLFTVRPEWVAPGSAGDHTFLNSPAPRWNPCETITYRVNANQARPGALRDVKTAVAQISLATGLHFKYVGSSNIIPQRDMFQSFGKGTDVLIGWAKASQTDLLRGGNAAGAGGPLYSSGYQDGAGKPVHLSFKGRVAINTKYNSLIKAGSGTGYTRVELLMHEIGHVVGLDHAANKTQIMYPSMQKSKAVWGAGDVEGLRKVGFTGGCIARDSGRTGARQAITADAPGRLASHVVSDWFHAKH